MKKSLFIKSFSLFLAMLIFVCSSGIVVKNHYCSRTKVLKNSLFNQKIECNHHHDEHNHSDFSQNHFESKSCCSEYSTYLRFIENFNIASHKIIFDLDLFKTIVFDFSVPTTIKSFSAQLIHKISPPPIISGKELLIAFLQLKFDDILL